ncbi:hypothetical protein BaRGS_00034162 [Batillaria attramentaria]|uniref:Uncharacterized protein n=1 Tax=Batillaria attramentaria TaxID=370345 RepID=A0ABD0JHY9_9CAEN
MTGEAAHGTVGVVAKQEVSNRTPLVTARRPRGKVVSAIQNGACPIGESGSCRTHAINESKCYKKPGVLLGLSAPLRNG